MEERITAFLKRLLPHKVIVNCEREPYLIRFYLLRTKRMAIFLHRFIRSDEDRALHDHPWNFIVIPIWRGYIEHSEWASLDPYGEWPWSRLPAGPRTKRVYPILGTRFRRAEYKHRVELLKTVHDHWMPEYVCTSERSAWSLFIRFTERRVWGFWLRDGWIAWNKWWQNTCE